MTFLSNFQNTTHQTTITKPIIFAILSLGLLTLSACTPSPKGDTSAQFEIVGDSVILDKSHILGIKTELYQPSFELQGVILPHRQAIITAPTDGTVNQLWVQNGTPIKEGMRLLSIAKPAPITPHDKLDDTKHTLDSNLDTPQNTLVDSLEDKLEGNLESNLESNLENDLKNITQEITPNEPTPSPTHHPISNPISQADTTVTAPMAGVVYELNIKAKDSVKTNDTLLTINDDSLFEFVSILPKTYQDHLKIGQQVNFTVKTTNTPQSELEEMKAYHEHTFAGQVAIITPINDKQLSVTVYILPKDDVKLRQGLQVGGRINYGSLDIGVVIPDYALSDGTSLTELKTPPFKPATPLLAHIWTIHQDGTLHLAEVQVVAYRPDTDRYLITGMRGDCLIVTANLPKSAEGKYVKVR